jgi:hypothetical protein
VPHGRREDTWFRDWARTTPRPGSSHDVRLARVPADPGRIWRTFQAPAPSVDSYRVIWVHSSSKAARDESAGAARIEVGLAAIDAIQARLASPQSRLKTRVAAEQPASTALAAAAARWGGFTITETAEIDHRQQNRGRPGTQTRYRLTEKVV